MSVIVAVEENLFQLDPFEPQLQVLLFVCRWVELVRGRRGKGAGHRCYMRDI